MVTVLAGALIALPAAARAGGPSWFVTGGPGVARSADPLAPDVDTTRAPISAEVEPVDAEPGERARVLMLGVGVAGSEGRIRGGAELLSLVGRRGDATSGYTGLVTYAGGDLGAGFVQTGLGLGSFWGGERRGLDRLAGAAHGEIGVRLGGQLAVLVRGDLLVGRELVAPIASVGLQWAPGGGLEAPRPPPREDRRNPLRGQPAIRGGL